MDDKIKLTVKEAFLAMFRFLEYQYEMTNSEGISDLLGDLQIMEDGFPVDQGDWEVWLQSIHDIKNGIDNSKLVLRK